MMTTQDLIELSMLYSLGLLDDEESASYESAMLHAAPSVRQRVLEESRRMSDLGDLLPDVEPDGSVREMVLAAVRAAVREEENEVRIAGRIAPAPAAPSRSSAPAQPRLSTTPRVHRLWRAATIGLTAATIALTVISINNIQSFNDIETDTLVMKIYDQAGAENFDDIVFNPATRRVAMVSTNGSSNSAAAVFHNPDRDSALLLVKNLRTSKDKPFRLVVLDENDNIVREVATFASEGEVGNFEIQVNNLQAQDKLAIYESVENEINAQEEPLLVSVDQSL